MSLRNKITVIICLIIVVSLIMLSCIIYVKSASILDNEAEIYMQSQLERAQENIDLLIKYNQLEAEHLALDRKVMDFLQGSAGVEETNQYLISVMEKKNQQSNNNYFDLFILNTDGFIVATTMPIAMNLDLSMREYLHKSQKYKITVTSDILIARSDQSLIVITVSPIFNDKGQDIAYVGIAIKSEYFSDIVKGLTLGKSGYYAIVDSNNMILSHPDKDLIATESQYILPKGLINSSNMIMKQTVVNSQGHNEIQIYKYMKSNNWILIAALQEQELRAKSLSLLTYVIGIGILMIVAAVFTGVYISNKISAPIAVITDYINQLAAGKLMLEKSISESIKNIQTNERTQENITESDAFTKDHSISLPGIYKKIKTAFTQKANQFEAESDKLIKTSQELMIMKEDVSQRTAKFISTLSHDLKTPLSLIKGCIRGIMSDVIQDEEVKKRFLHNIYQSAGDLEKIICDILDSAYEAQYCLKLSKEHVNSINFTEDLFEKARQYVTGSQREFEGICTCQEGLLYIDYVKIIRVWDNLLNNAVKYSEEGSKIQVHIQQKGNLLELRVTDEGIGIKKDDQDKIFQMFYQGKHEKNSGYGLGLFIAKSIIEAHESELNVKSQYREGTSFWFYLEVI